VQVRIVELFARLPVTGLIVGAPRTQAVLFTVNAAELFIVELSVPSQQVSQACQVSDLFKTPSRIIAEPLE
jgi:hypothetical protein